MVKRERICSNSLFFLGSCNDFFFVPPMGHVFINKAHGTSLGWYLCHGCKTGSGSRAGRPRSTFPSDFESLMLIVLCCLSNSSGACCSACVQQ